MIKSIVSPSSKAVTRQSFDDMLAATRALDPIKTAVVHPCDDASLQGALAARDEGLIIPVLVGPQARIQEEAIAASPHERRPAYR